MPILDVELVGPLPDAARGGLAAQLAEAAGEALGARPGGAWVRLRSLPRADYAENDGGPPEGVLPVFVRVLRAQVPAGPELEREMSGLAAAVAEVTGRPVEHVHVLYEPPAAGRIGFGGRLLRGP